MASPDERTNDAADGSAPSPIDGSSIVRRRTDVLWRTAPGLLVVAAVDGAMLVADGSAPAVWRCLGSAKSLVELTAELAEAFGVPDSTVDAQVRQFVEQLLRDGWLVEGGADDVTSNGPPSQRHPALVASARLGLPEPVAAAQIDDEALEPVLADARFDGMTGFLAQAIRDGVVGASTDVLDAVDERWHAALAGAVQVEALAVRAAETLDMSGARWRLTKGAVLAHLDYPDQLSMRTFGDVDVVVHPGDWDLVLDALTSAGHERVSPELRRGYDVRFGKGATFEDQNGLELDLHLRFAVGRFGVRSQMAELFDRSESIDLAGRSIPTLAGPDRLLHACFHLVLGGFSALRAARDVRAVAPRDGCRLGRNRSHGDVMGSPGRGRERHRDHVEPSRAHVRSPAARWARAQPLSRADARTIDIFERQRPFREQAITAFSSLPPHAVPAYAAALLFPTPGARQSGASSSVGHALSRVRRITRVG